MSKEDEGQEEGQDKGQEEKQPVQTIGLITLTLSCFLIKRNPTNSLVQMLLVTPNPYL